MSDKETIRQVNTEIAIDENGWDGDPQKYRLVDAYEQGHDAAFEHQAIENERLTAELKELREFVGAMNRVAIEEWHGFYQDGAFWFFADDGEGIASGTDPFDAWRKMNAGEGE